MSNVCQTCGVVGWVVAHIYCDSCSDFFVHRYCLEKMPPTFEEHVFWLCDNCQPAAKVSPLPQVGSENCLKPAAAAAAKASLLPEQVRTALKPEDATPHPVVHPIWRGHLTMADPKRDSSYRLVAHLSSFASPRVFKEARFLLPESLSSQLLPRLSVWPKGFPKHQINCEHVHLYFYPEAPTDRVSFNCLLAEMIQKDVALRVVVGNAELFIFSSTKLTPPNWRLQGSLYLWGFFQEQAS